VACQERFHQQYSFWINQLRISCVQSRVSSLLKSAYFGTFRCRILLGCDGFCQDAERDLAGL